jgi:hypothetical protein
MSNGTQSDGVESEGVKKRFDYTVILSAGISALAAVGVAWITASYAGAQAGETKVAGLIEIPVGTVSFFDLAGCPPGWREKPNAIGRYLVGLNPASQGSLNQTQGEPLSNLENRAVGNHTHQDRTYAVGGRSGSGQRAIAWGGVGAAERQSLTVTGLPPEPAAGRNNVDGTNAPYLQLLVCEKEH